MTAGNRNNDNKNCKDLRELLSPYIEGELTEEDTRALELHLEECPACLKELDLIRKTVGALRDMPQVPPPPEIMAKVKEHLHRRRAWLPRWGEWFDLSRTGALARAAAVVIVLGVILIVQQRFPGLKREGTHVSTPRMVPSEPGIRPSYPPEEKAPLVSPEKAAPDHVAEPAKAEPDIEKPAVAKPPMDKRTADTDQPPKAEKPVGRHIGRQPEIKTPEPELDTSAEIMMEYHETVKPPAAPPPAVVVPREEKAEGISPPRPEAEETADRESAEKMARGARAPESAPAVDSLGQLSPQTAAGEDQRAETEKQAIREWGRTSGPVLKDDVKTAPQAVAEGKVEELAAPSTEKPAIKKGPRDGGGPFTVESQPPPPAPPPGALGLKSKLPASRLKSIKRKDFFAGEERAAAPLVQEEDHYRPADENIRASVPEPDGEAGKEARSSLAEISRSAADGQRQRTYSEAETAPPPYWTGADLIVLLEVPAAYDYSTHLDGRIVRSGGKVGGVNPLAVADYLRIARLMGPVAGKYKPAGSTINVSFPAGGLLRFLDSMPEETPVRIIDSYSPTHAKISEVTQNVLLVPVLRSP